MSYSRWRSGVHGRLCQGHGGAGATGHGGGMAKRSQVHVTLQIGTPRVWYKESHVTQDPLIQGKGVGLARVQASRATDMPLKRSLGSNCTAKFNTAPQGQTKALEAESHRLPLPHSALEPATSGPLPLLSSQPEVPRSRCTQPLATVLGLPPQGTQLDCTRNVCPYPVSLHHFTAHPALPG